MSMVGWSPGVGRWREVIRRWGSQSDGWGVLGFWVVFVVLALGSVVLLGLAFRRGAGPQIVSGRRETVDLAIDFGFSIFALGIGIVLALLTVRPGGKRELRISPWPARWLALGTIATACAYNVEIHRYLAGASWFEYIHFPFHLAAAGAYLFGLLLFPDGRVLGRKDSTMALVVKLLLFLVLVGVILRTLEVSQGLGILTFGIGVFIVGLVSQLYRSGDLSGLLRLARIGGRPRHGIPTSPSANGDVVCLRARAFALTLVFALVLFPMLAVMNLGLHGWHVGTVLDQEAILVALMPLLAGIPVGFLLWALLGSDRATELSLDGIPKTVIVFGYVTLAVIVDPLLRRLTAPFFDLEPEGLITSFVTTLLIVLTLEESKEYVERRVHARLQASEEPHALLARFARELAGATSPEEALRMCLNWSLHGIRGGQGRVRLFLTEGDPLTAPEDAPADWPGWSVEILHGDMLVGDIALARARGRRPRKKHQSWIVDIASVAAPSLVALSRSAERQTSTPSA
jgi:hypothetical protein